MNVRFRKVVAGTALVALAMVASDGVAGAAATPKIQIPFRYNLAATTTVKKLNLTVVVPNGTFKGAIDLSALQLTGIIKLPATAVQMSLGSIPVATAVFKMRATQPVTGTVDIANQQVTATAVFDIQLVSVTTPLLPHLNLVGDSCMTSTPISVTMSGSLAPPLTFAGTYTIPALANCGPLTPILNLVVPGPGNTFSATATPKK